MGQLVWNDTGSRLFELGLDRGVLYTVGGLGVAWNGLISVKEVSDGGDAASYYIDGVKYLNISSPEDFNGTIEAFTYPDEFALHDGTFSYDNGLLAFQQRRIPFALSYRTRVGNDIQGDSYAYKLHIVYNAIVAPADRDYVTIGDRADPMNFSWSFTTTAEQPISKNLIAPLAHVVIDSRKTNPTLLRYIEEHLYGSQIQEASLISLNDLFNLFDYDSLTVEISADRDFGLNELIAQTDGSGDLIGGSEDGLYNALSETRLIPTNIEGLYRLNFVDDSDDNDDESDPGIFSDIGLIEDLPNDPGTYLIAGTGVSEDTPGDPGTYIISGNSGGTTPSFYITEDLPDNPGRFTVTGTSVVGDPFDEGTFTNSGDFVREDPANPGIFSY